MENGERRRKHLDYTGAPLREWLARWLKVGKAQRPEAETRAEALATAYCQKLVAELQEQTLAFLDMAKLLDLEASYVPLQVSITSDKALHLHVGESNERSLSKVMPPEEALLQFRHLVVLGDPGAGKTTMLRYLTLLAAQGRLENLPNFPILVPLNHFAAIPHINLLDFVISEVEARCGFSELHPEPRPEPFDPSTALRTSFAQDKLRRRPAEGPRPDGSLRQDSGQATSSPQWPVEGLRPYLEERLEKGSVLFLLDGLGEVAYRRVVGQINVLAARYPNCSMIVTATTNLRRESWKGLLAASFYTAEVLGFNKDDIQRFTVNWFGADSDRVQGFQDALAQNPQMWVLAANPLLLSLMAFAFEQDGELPERRVGLYSRAVEMLLKPDPEHSRRDRDLKRIHSFITTHKRSLLEGIALHFHRRRALLFPEDELRGVIASHLPTVLSSHRSKPVEGSKGNTERSLLDTPADQTSVLDKERSLLELSGQHGLLQEQAVGWYGFPHPTWQEYFAAAAISKRASNTELEWVLESLHDPWWEGTVLFLAGVLENVMPFLESILAQEEDIFYSNLLLAGRCLAGVSRIEGLGPSTALRPFDGAQGRLRSGQGSGQRLGEDIIERLKRLVEGRYHRLLQQQAINVLAEIGGEAIVSFFVALLRRKAIDLDVRAEVAKILGSLHEKSVVPDLLAFLTDEKLAPSLRGNIAQALGSLGDTTDCSLLIIPPLLALLPDETVDPFVRGKAAEALALLGGESVVSPLLALLPDERIDFYVRERIAEVLASLGDGRTSCQLVPLLPDERIHPSVRRRVAEAVGSLGDKSAIPDLLALLSDETVDPSVRGKAAEAFSVLGAESAFPPLLAILDDEKVNYYVRITVAEILGVLGDESVASKLLPLLSDEKIDPDVRAGIAGALSILGEKSVVPHLLSLLPNERIDHAVRWRIVDTLRALGDKTIIPHLRALLPNEKIDPSVRWAVAEALAREPTEIGEQRMEKALGSLDDRSRVPQLLALLKDESIEPSVSRRIIEALGSLGNDRDTVEGLAALLDREDIGPSVYEALFHVSQRARVRVFAKGKIRPLVTSK
jgi:HEAT repeat protein